MMHRELEIRPMPERELEADNSAAWFDTAISVECLFLRPELIDVALLIKRKDCRFKRLVLFLAVTIIHELCHYKRHVYNRAVKSARRSTVVLHHPEAGWVFEEILLNGIMELDYDTPDDLKLTLASDISNPLTLLSSARDIQNSLRHDQQPVVIPGLTSNVRLSQDDIDMLATFDSDQETTTADESPRAKFKIVLTNKSTRPVQLPVDVLPIYTLNAEAFVMLPDGSKGEVDTRSLKPRLMGTFPASILQIGESREYHVNLSSLFHFSYGQKYKIRLQFQTRVGFSGVAYHFRSNPQTITVEFVKKTEDRATRSCLSRSPVDSLCRLKARVYVHSRLERYQET